MRTLYLFLSVFLWILMGFSQNSLENLAPTKEIIIRYEVMSSNSSQMYGRYILDEQKQFVSLLQNQLSLSIKHSQPVFYSFIKKMVDQEISESQLLEQIRQQNQSRRGRSLPKYKLGPNNSFCRVLCLAVETEDLGKSIRRIQNASQSLEPFGFKINYVSANPSYSSDRAPNDPLYFDQYAHQLTGAPTAWSAHRGSEKVVIGVLDSGIDFTHEDLKGNVLQGADFVNWTDLEEWQKLAREDYTEFDLDPTDFWGHGTSVSGIIASRANNQKGISGVCPDCTILPLRVLALRYNIEENGEGIDTVLRSRATHSNLADAIAYGVGAGADIFNFSLGGAPPDTQGVYYQAIKLAYQNGVVMVGSAGNDNVEKEHYPAAYKELIAVASTNESDLKSSFSNHGDWVEVSAPGSRILTTIPTFHGISLGVIASINIPNQEFFFAPNLFGFSALTLNGPLSAPLSFIGMAREQDVLNESYDWDLLGKIALIERGDISFKEKVDRAKSFGAIGVIIFNNSSGSFSGTLIEEQENPIPVISLSREEGQHLLDAWRQDPELEVSLSVKEILGYQRQNGTSFSAPYVAGMAGLILSQWPELNPEEVRTLIRESVDEIDHLNPEYVGKLGTGRVSLSKLFENLLTSTPKEVSQEEFAVHPNPFNDVFQINDLIDARLNRLRVLNTLGQEVYRLEDIGLLQQSSLAIDLSNQPPGNYFLIGDSPEGQRFRQIVKTLP